MANENDEALLAELGLTGDNADASAQEPAAEAADAGEGKTRAKRVELKINKASTGLGLLPARAAFGGGGGPRGSKYPFEDLGEPTKDVDGNVTGYAFFTILLEDVDGADQKRLQSAIQAAVAAQNKGSKEHGKTTRYVSRAVLDEAGAYTGSSVYRVDDTIGDDDADGE